MFMLAVILERNQKCLERNEKRLKSNETCLARNKTRGGNLLLGGTVNKFDLPPSSLFGRSRISSRGEEVN